MSHLVDMGIYNKQNKNSYYTKDGYYKNTDAVENVIYYITRSRKNETRANELIAVGTAGVVCNTSPEAYIRAFKMVQDYYSKGNIMGRRIVHEVYMLHDSELQLLDNSYKNIYKVALCIAQYYFQQGFQTVFAIHNDGLRHIHIHFAINSVSYLDGKKYHSAVGELQKKKSIFDQYVADIAMQNVRNVISPIEYAN